MLRLIQLSCDDDIELTGDSNFIGLYYIQELKKIDFIKYSKINVILRKDAAPKIIGENTKICNVYILYDPASYNKIETEEGKRNEILTLFHKGLILLCEKFNWNKNVFDKIRGKLIAADFDIKMIFNKKLANSSKPKVYAYIELSLKMKSTLFQVNFEKGGEVICSLPFYEGSIGYIYWNLLFRYQYWENSETLVITDYQKEILFKCNYVTGAIDVVFDLTKKGKEQLEGKLKTWRYDISSNERGILWNECWLPLSKEILE